MIQKDKHPDFVEENVINFEKLMQLGEIIAMIKQLQLIPYRYKHNERLQDFLQRTSPLPEEMLYKHSVLCEA